MAFNAMGFSFLIIGMNPIYFSQKIPSLVFYLDSYSDHCPLTTDHLFV